MFALLKLIPLRDYAFAGALLALTIFVIYWNHRERVIGEQECKAAQDAAQVRAQAAIDANAKAANAKLQAAYDAQKYMPMDYHPPIDCGSVPSDLLMRINSAGQTGKH